MCKIVEGNGKLCGEIFFWMYIIVRVFLKVIIFFGRYWFICYSFFFFVLNLIWGIVCEFILVNMDVLSFFVLWLYCMYI